MKRPIFALIAVVAFATALWIGSQVITRPGLPVSSIPTVQKLESTAAKSIVASSSITVDYPVEGSVFPPDMMSPLFAWHDANLASSRWQIEVTFADGSAALHAEARGQPPEIGEIDARCVSETNELPKLTPQEASSHTWRPDDKTWAAIRAHAVEQPATVTINGFTDQNRPVSSGRVSVQISKDPVGAPIFYRDVPLMPAKPTPGVVTTFAKRLMPLINWRLRNVADTQSRVLLTQMPACANCHSFSRDGKTLGMDLDGKQNDKAIYAIASVVRQMSIRNQDVISWNSSGTKPTDRAKGIGIRFGFMSQVSPAGDYVATTLDPQIYFVSLPDYNFLQVFYPTRGLLGWYARANGSIQPLPGADDPRYVQTGATWSPDGKYLVFSRAEATEAYPIGRPLAKFANDPNEIQIQYDLYRIPFNAGKGGQAQPIAGASQNGMSNSFPKVSPDGRWIVFVEARNGQLMRPDGKLYIVPADGGQARAMHCNTERMNSWHSFSPNGRWLVFSSKARSPYTQMCLTHIDSDGNDSPAILIENSTAANRAVNIPEFVNIAPDGLANIDVPAAESYRHFDQAYTEMEKHGMSDGAIAEFRKSIEIDPQFAEAHNDLGFALAGRGQDDEAIAHYQKALEIRPSYADAHNNLGLVLARQGKIDEAIAHYQKALEIKPGYAEAHLNLGLALAHQGHIDEAVAHYQQAIEIRPAYVQAQVQLAGVFVSRGRGDEAIQLYRKALEIKPDYAEAHNDLGLALTGSPQAGTGQVDEAIAHYEKALEIKPDYAEAHLNLGIALASRERFEAAIAHYEKALTIKPDLAEAHNSLGIALAAGRGQIDAAIAHFEKALEIKPDYASARQNLEFARSKRTASGSK